MSEAEWYKERIREMGYCDGRDWFQEEMTGGAITPDEFEHRMKLVEEVCGDPEDTHIIQDELMLEALRQNGYGDGAKLYYESVKWFA